MIEDELAGGIAPQGFGDDDVAGFLDCVCKLRIPLRLVRDLECKVEHDDSGMRGRESTHEPGMSCARPVARLGRQAQLLPGLFVDRDDYNIERRCYGTAQVEQPMEADVILERHSIGGRADHDADQTDQQSQYDAFDRTYGAQRGASNQTAAAAS